MGDATPTLAKLMKKDVKVLAVTGEWDGMATIEGTIHWLKSRFRGDFKQLRTDQCKEHMQDLSRHLRSELANAQFAHVTVLGSGHMVAFHCPDTLGMLLRTFLSKQVVQKYSVLSPLVSYRSSGVLLFAVIGIGTSLTMLMVAASRCRASLRGDVHAHRATQGSQIEPCDFSSASPPTQ